MNVYKKQKLLIVSDYFYPHWTGIAKSMYYLIQAISPYYDITVLTTQFDKSLKKKETILSATVLREDYLFSLSRAKYSPHIVIRFAKIVRSFDVVLVNSPFSNILPVILIATLFRKRNIILHHGDLILPKGLVNRLIEWVFDASTLMACFMTNKLATFTDDYARHSRILRHFLYKCTAIIIPIQVFIDRAMQHKSNHIDTTLKELRKKGKTLIGIAGRFVEEKGFDILLDAMPDILKEIPGAHIVFAGQTSISYEQFFSKSRDKLQKVTNHITLLGLLDEDELISFYNNIDMFIIPSRSDCFPIVQLEALMLGVPVVVSDIPGAREPVKRTGYGVVFTSQDKRSLVKAILQMVETKKDILKRFNNVLLLLNTKKNVSNIKKFLA